MLTVTGEEAAAFGLGQVVNDEEELKALYGLRGKVIRVDGPSWVDSLVTILTDPYVSWLLLFVGLFMLVIELKLPGIGLPAITSALAFLLFFWSHYLSGTADQLEIILFLVGHGLPGGRDLRVPGLRHLRHERDPAHALQHRDGQPHIRLADPGIRIPGNGPHAAPSAWACSIAVGGRGGRPGPLFPVVASLQSPGPEARALDRGGCRGRPAGEAVVEGYESLAFLIGETGRTTAPLRPTGKARFGRHAARRRDRRRASTSRPTASSRSSTSRGRGSSRLEADVIVPHFSRSHFLAA